MQTNNHQRYGPKYSLYRDKAFEKWFAFLSWRNSWNSESVEAYLKETNPRLIFPALMRRVYSGVPPKPEGYYLKPVSVPDDMTIFNAEESIFREMPLIIAYYFKDNIRYTQKGYPNAASGRKMAKSLLLKDFPRRSENGLRALMIAGLFTDKFSLESLSEPPLPVLHQLFSTDFTRNPVAPYLLSHLKGLTAFHHRYFNGSITGDLFTVFQKIPTDKWIAFENIKEYASTHFINLQTITSHYDLDRLSLADEIRYTSDN